MSKMMTGEPLDALSTSGVFEVLWDGEHFSIRSPQGTKSPTYMTPRELAAFAGELMEAAVKKGDEQ
jgi:hypothetical protein